MSEIVIRAGTVGELPTVLSLFDDAVSWLASEGRHDQWGTEPWSAKPEAVQRVQEMLGNGDLWIAEIGGESAGVMVLGSRPHSYVSTVDEPERYVLLLLSARRFTGHGVGRSLLAHAQEQAQQAGADLLRVDCWAGGDKRLVDYYVKAGFTPTVTAESRGRPIQVLERRLR